MERDGRVSVDVSRHHFVKDYDYLIVSISALEVTHRLLFIILLQNFDIIIKFIIEL